MEATASGLTVSRAPTPRGKIASMFSLVTALTLAFPVVNPNVPMPDGLEVCILKAEICSMEGRLPICGGEVEEPRLQCISDFDDCAAGFKEAQEPSCRMDYVTCRLESYAGYDNAKFCYEVYEACPSIKFIYQW